MATPALIQDFGRQVREQPGIDADIVETVVDYKDSYFDDPDPAHWTVDVLTEILLQVLPRKVSAPDEWFAAVTPTMFAYLRFLADQGPLARGSDSPKALLIALQQLGDRVLAASRDPRNFGMAKAIFSRVGFDPSLPDPATAAMEAFNSLPDAERAAVLDPALRHQGLGWTADLPDLDEPDGTLGRELPMIWLPPAAELAPAVRAAPLVNDLLRLTAWNGARRKVTRKEVLPLADARRACADLGLPIPPGPLRSAEGIPALHRLWSLAEESDLLRIDGAAAVPGPAADLPAAPDDVLSWWTQLLDTCLLDGLELAEGPELADDLDDDVVDAVDVGLRLALLDLYSAGPLPLPSVDEAIAQVTHVTLTDMFIATDLTEEQVRQQAVRRWRAHLDQLVELGAATAEDGRLDLTPLGRFGVRALALDDGGEAPLVEDPAALDAATLLRALVVLSKSLGAPLLTAWSAAREPAQAVEEILDAARAGTASTRVSAVTALKDTLGDHLGGPGRDTLQALCDDPILAAYAHTLLTPPGEPVQLPHHLRQWIALESVALAIESGAFGDDGHDSDALAELWQLVEQGADLESAQNSSHPQLEDALTAIAGHHPRGRIRKAAKKALFKLANPRK